MAVYNLNLSGKQLGRLAQFVNETASGTDGDRTKQEGSLATTLKPIGTGEINILRDYQWTLSNIISQIDEIPYIRLREFKCVDSSIKKQLQFYFQLNKDILSNVAGKNFATEQSMDVYQDIWPKDHPTNFSYIFPYFTKSGFEIASEPWSNLDSIGDSIKGAAEGLAKMVGGETAKMVADKFGKVLDLAAAGSNAIQNYKYPTVGVTDRPKMFMGHNDRTINISFTLYNTVTEQAWQENRDFIYLMMSQNLFNKRDLTTGVPPVFYDVYIPGQYFSYASAITNFKVDYLGNQRLLYGDYVVPDAYEITITLTELVKPSKNQFEAVQSDAARSNVRVKKVDPEQLEAQENLARRIGAKLDE